MLRKLVALVFDGNLRKIEFSFYSNSVVMKSMQGHTRVIRKITMFCASHKNKLYHELRDGMEISNSYCFEDQANISLEPVMKIIYPLKLQNWRQ